MMRVKSIMFSVGDKIILQEFNKDFLKKHPDIHMLLGKEVTIKTLYSIKDEDYEKIDGAEICKTCAYGNISAFYIEEDTEWELIKDNINIPETFKEIDYKKLCNELLNTLQEITEAYSPGDMYDLAKEALEKNKQK